MTTQDQIIAFFTPERRSLNPVSPIERLAGLPRNTLQNVLNGVKYRHLTNEQIEKLLPVLKSIGFKLKKTIKDEKTKSVRG